MNIGEGMSNKPINLMIRRVKPDHWQVWWDDRMVYELQGKDAEFYVDAFVDGLERGLTGSYTKLYANSQVKIGGVFYEHSDDRMTDGERQDTFDRWAADFISQFNE